MQDLYLSFADEAAAHAVLYRTEGAGEDTPGYEMPNFKNIDTIGVIYKDEQPIAGWHVNVRLLDGEDGSALSAYQVNPATPVRVWG
jgi:hypothetical protein